MPFRSLSLWLGLFGLVFLLWAWADSFERTSGIDLQRGHPFVSAQHHSSTVVLFWGRDSRPASDASLFREISTDPERPLLWARLRLEKVNFAGRFTTSLRIPHWLLLSLYVPAWVILLAWRWKKRAAAKEHAPGGTPSATVPPLAPGGIVKPPPFIPSSPRLSGRLPLPPFAILLGRYVRTRLPHLGGF